MDSQYYTPDVSEFFVGFEYEEKSSGLWTKQVYNDKSPILTGQWFDGHTYMYNTIEQYIQQEIIRVKYLDREDIESLGFFYYRGVKETGSQGMLLSNKLTFTKKKNFYLVFDTVNREVIIEKLTSNEQFFKGFIKNKSQLVKVLEMLDIE